MYDKSKTGILNSKLLLFGVSALVVFPFLALYFFNQPTTEDFYYAGVVKESGFLDAQRYFYKFWGGRISYYALTSLNPLFFNSVTGYNVLGLLIFLLFFYVLYLIIYEFLKEILRKSEIYLLLFSISFLYLYSMPSAGQGFYWLGSALNYHLAIVIILLFYLSYMRIQDNESLSRKTFYSVICGAMSIIVAGLNEISATIFSMSVILLLLRDYFVNKKINQYLIVFTILTLTADYICFSAPGNSNRSDLYYNSQDLYNSVIGPAVFVPGQLVNWIFFSPLLAITFLLIPIFLKILESGKPGLIFSINPVVSAVLLLLFLFTGTSIMIWSNGIVPHGRILNFLFFLFLAGWFYNVIVFLIRINKKYKLTAVKIPGYVYAGVFMIVILFLFKDNNLKTAYTDLLSGKAQKYHNDLNERYRNIRKDNSETCIVDPIENVPESFFFQEIDYVPTTVYNLGYQMYFKKKSIVLRKKQNE